MKFLFSVSPLENKINLNYIQIFSPYRAVNTLRLCFKNQSMLYREIIAVCSEIYTKTHKYAVWAERRIFLVLKLVVNKVTTKHKTIFANKCTVY